MTPRIVFVNGCFSEKLSTLSEEIELKTDGVFLHIPKNKTLTVPIYCIFNAHKDNTVSNTIVVGENSQVTVIEEYVGVQPEAYSTRSTTTIQAEKNARVEYYKIQNESLSASHTANVSINQHQDSQVKAFFFSRGGRVEREDVVVQQEAAGAEVYLTGFYAPHQDNQQINHHIHVDHLAAHGTSSMVYKGILDKKSRAVFNGKVFVHQDAQQINAHQENHNLLLSNTAEVNTKPELEIYADDVKCTHGATVGQLDNKALFYLRSRGLDEAVAKQMLVHAFADEIFTQIKNSDIKKYVQQRVGHHDEL